jgi:hypothetical protein
LPYLCIVTSRVYELWLSPHQKDRAYTAEEIQRLLTKADNLYQIVVYANLTNEEYYTFTTPEAAAAIDSYLAYRERYGEKLTPKSPLIREQFNISEPRPAKPLSEKTIGGFLLVQS